MDDDKDKSGVLPGEPGKRTAPTIDLEASEVTDSPRGSDSPETHEAEADSSEKPAEPAPEFVNAPASSRGPSLALSAVTGAVAALLVLGGAKFSGLLDAPPPPVTNSVSRSDMEALGARLAKMESDLAKPARPAADPAITARLGAMEAALTSLRNDVNGVRGQGEKVAAALNEIKSAAPQGIVAAGSPAVDVSAIEQRLEKVERAAAALNAAATAPAPPPVEDPNVRRMAAASLLDAVVQQGAPYAPALAAVRSMAGDAGILKPLDAFAATGIPDARTLSRDLLALLPKLAPKPDVQPAPSGVVERLQQSAAKLVRIQRIDAAGSGNAAILARVSAAVQRDDLAEAKRELLQLPESDRAPAQAWIAKVDARDAALTASRKFVSDIMTALSKPAQ